MKGFDGVLKRRVKNKDVLLHGGVMDSRSGSVIEMYHDIGFDVVFLDREHTALNHETLLEHIRLARALEIPCMVRVIEGTYSEIGPFMDSGVDGIYVPRIRSREEVVELVRLIRFPPRGVKGFGASTCPAGKYIGWSPDPQKQLDYFDNHFVLGIQMETAEAFADLDGILSVPGIDIAIVGNDDLSLGLGIPCQTDRPDYIAAVRKIIAACNKYGVLPGIACGDPIAVRRWKNEGMRAFWTASDIVSMWTHTKCLYENIRRELER